MGFHQHSCLKWPFHVHCALHISSTYFSVQRWDCLNITCSERVLCDGTSIHFLIALSTSCNYYMYLFACFLPHSLFMFWSTAFLKRAVPVGMVIPLGQIPSKVKVWSLHQFHWKKSEQEADLLGLLLGMYWEVSEPEPGLLVCFKDTPSLVKLETWPVVTAAVLIARTNITEH